MKTIEERIRESRVYAGISQLELSKRLGVSPRTAYSYEKNAAKITLAMSQIIANTCNVNEIWLLTGKGEMLLSEPETNPNKTINFDDINGVALELRDIIEKFRNKERAINLNQKLVELESLSEKSFKRAENYIYDLVDMVKDIVEENAGNIEDRKVGERGRK